MYLFHRIEIITIFAPDFIEVQFGKSILYFDRLKWKFGHRNLIRQISVRMLLPGMYIHRYGHTVPCCIYPRWELQTFTMSYRVSQIPHLGLWSEVALTFLLGNNRIYFIRRQVKHIIPNGENPSILRYPTGHTSKLLLCALPETRRRYWAGWVLWKFHSPYYTLFRRSSIQLVPRERKDDCFRTIP